MHVKIKSGGDSYETHIFDSAGNEIRGVTAVAWSVKVNDIARAVLTLKVVEMDVEGEAQVVGPNGKEISRIEYADGTVDDFDTA